MARLRDVDWSKAEEAFPVVNGYYATGDWNYKLELTDENLKELIRGKILVADLGTNEVLLIRLKGEKK